MAAGYYLPVQVPRGFHWQEVPGLQTQQSLTHIDSSGGMEIRASHYSSALNYCLVRLSRTESQTEVMNVHSKSRKDAAEATYERADVKQ